MSNNPQQGTVTAVDIEGVTFEVPVSELFWRPSAYGIVFKEDKLLLVPQFKTKHDLPGGGIDLGELPEQGVVREVKEETGIDVCNPKLVGIASSFFTFSRSEGKTSQSILLYYLCEYVGGKISAEGFDEWEKQYTDLAEWVPLDKIDDIIPASSFDFRQYVKDAAQQAL